MVPEGLRIALSYARAFREAGLPFMVVGAWAVMAHGWPRSTSDIDFVVNSPFSERAPVESLLRSLGHKEFEQRKDEWGERLVVALPGELQLEVFFTPRRPPYDEEFARRVVLDIEGEPVPFIAPADLVLRKLVNTRLRRGLDFDDVVGVLSVQRGKLDVETLRERAAFYRVGELLERAIKEADATESA